MILSKAAILAVRGMDMETKKRLAEALNVNMQTAYRWIADNDDNLTKAAALKIIREVTGLADDQILEEVTNQETEPVKVENASH